MNSFDPNKPVQTRDGRKARILCTNLNLMTPIVAAITNSGDGITFERVMCYFQGGVYGQMGKPDPQDLVNVPEEKTVWLAVYCDRVFECHDYEPQHNRPGILARINVTYKVGDGLTEKEKEALK